MIKIKEIWKDIENYENLYQISNLGRIKSLCFNKIKILKPHNNRGYYDVTLYKNGKHKQHKIHRLVASAFLINNEQKTCVNHKDGNKTNNNVDNLEWVTPKENVIHAYKNNLHKKYCGSNHSNAKKIKQYDLQGNFIKEWGSIVEAAIYYKTTKENIFSCLKHKSKTAKNYKWEYSQMK